MWTGERRTVAIIGLAQVTAILFGMLACSTACKAHFGGGTATARILRDYGWCLLAIPLAWTAAAAIAGRAGLLASWWRAAVTLSGIVLGVALAIVMGLPLAQLILGWGSNI